MLLFRSPTLFGHEDGSETKRKQAPRLGKKGIVHLPDSKVFCLFGNHGMPVFVTYKDSETTQRLCVRRTTRSEADQRTNRNRHIRCLKRQQTIA